MNTVNLEEIKWKQKAKVQRLKEGDNNTKFFHRIASTRRNFNSIFKLTINNEVVEDLPRMKNHVVEFFMDLYKDSGIARPKSDEVMLKTLSDTQRDLLEKPFEKNEVKMVIWSIEDDKYLGLDGFSMALYKN